MNDSNYREFVEQYGHIDFHLLKFLPTIKSKWQLKRQKAMEKLEHKMARTHQIATKNC